MKRILLILCAAALVGLQAPGAHAAQCGLPDTQPWWIDFSSGSVAFRYFLFGRPGVIAATEGGPTVPTKLRAYGAKTVYWEMRLNSIAGTPSVPANPAGIPGAAARLVAKAIDASGGCETPVIALNELFGAGTTTPWTKTNAQYRANVLALLRELSSRGARPFLLLSTAPYTGGTAVDWWRDAAQAADIVPEVYFSGPTLYRQGPILGSRTLRVTLRKAIQNFTELGIPPARLGFVLGFQSSPGGRDGLQPARAWYQVVKWQALAAKQVARELQVASVWSWGWATFSQDHSGDTEKAVAACVYLWARDLSLCDGPAKAGPDFDDSVTEGQIDSLPSGVYCSYGERTISTSAIELLARVTRDKDVAYTALLQRLVDQQQAPVTPADGLAAERSVVSLAFRGSLSAYLTALTRAQATRATGRELLADAIRRIRIQASLTPEQPKESALRTFYSSYPETLVRSVKVDGTPWWLGGRTSGFALQAAAPARVFKLPTGLPARIWTSNGPVTVTPLADPEALGALPLALARAPLRTALRWFSQGDAFDRWTAARQSAALRKTVCVRDDLPEVGSIDLSPFLPFLALNL